MLLKFERLAADCHKSTWLASIEKGYVLINHTVINVYSKQTESYISSDIY